LSGNASPGPERSGPGSQSLLGAILDTLDAAFRLSWPSVAAALAVFAALQGTRVALWNQMRREIRAGSTHLTPTDVAHLAAWFSNARELAVGEGRAVNWTGVMHRYVDDQPVASVRYAAVCLGASLGVALALTALLAIRGTRSRIVPFELGWRDRLGAVRSAVRSAAPWCAGVAALAAALCWHAGYDRLGRSRLLIDVLPGAMQGSAIMVMWAACALALSMYFLPPHARNLASAEARVCPRCRYPLRGLADRPCPECGREPSPRDLARTATVRERHVRLLRVFPIGIVVMALVLLACGAGEGRLANWVRLRTASIPWVVAPDRCVLGESPVLLKTIYGPVSLSARRASGVEGGDWIVVWERHAGANIPETARREYHMSLGSARNPSAAVMLETPSGPLWLWRSEDGATLFFGFPELIVIGR